MTDLTPLELEIVSRYTRRFADKGFPRPSEITVVSRTNTGAGRYTYLRHTGTIRLSDGPIYSGTYCYFDMDGLPDGASHQIYVKNGKAYHIEIAVNGMDHWDGVERKWSFMAE